MKRKAIILFGAASDVGVVREENQDAIGSFPPDTLNIETQKGMIFIVADGMGGHRGGRTASSMAVMTIPEVYFSMRGATVAASLQRAFQTANTRIYEKSLSDPACSGMGTTCVVLVLQETNAYIGHIGDSRVYRITRNKVIQLTNDHSKVAEMVRRGIITREEARTHPERSHLYRALGVRAETDIDVIADIALTTSESFLLCSDGLYEYVDEQEMQSVVLAKKPQDACDHLVARANERGGRDNISVMIVTVNYSGSFLDKLMLWETK